MINIQCGQLSGLRTTGLVSPAANQPIPQTCTYRINAVSFQICQMRLDFRQFSMAGPSVNPLANGAAFQKCNDDFLTVNGITICGENAGQHSESFEWKSECSADALNMSRFQFIYRLTREQASDSSKSQSRREMATAMEWTESDLTGTLRLINSTVRSGRRDRSCRRPKQPPTVASWTSSDRRGQSSRTGWHRMAACSTSFSRPDNSTRLTSTTAWVSIGGDAA